jgi:succinate dehydrogenase / fumarate reductase cytochrome b subunit
MSQHSQTAKPGGLSALFSSTIGLKILMAATGVMLVLFVLMHMLGNLQIFAGRAVFNNYAHFLQSLGGLLWVARIGLLLLVTIHVWSAVHLARLNDEARPHRYHTPRKYTVTTPAARYMLFSGVVIFLFIVYHLLHFTLGVTDPAGYNQWEVLIGEHWVAVPQTLDISTMPADHIRHDAYGMFVAGFTQPLVALFYMIANAALALHLAHACRSVFDTLGLSYGKYRAAFAPVGPAVGILVLLGNVGMPLAVVAGWITIH